MPDMCCTSAGLARSSPMATTLPDRPPYDIFRRDRPGWIPEWVGDDWDPHPYAYQADQQGKRLFYAGLGIQEYLLLDVEDDDERLLPQIGVSLWRMQDGTQLPVIPDDEGFLLLECLG